MKKYIYFSLLALLGFFTACDYNDKNFEELDELSKPVDVSQYEYEVTAGDITTIIVKALNANKNREDSAMATRLNADKTFSDLAPAATCIPYLLASKYFTADKGASANVTYEFKTGRTDYLAALSKPSYILTDKDYQSVWGKDFVAALTPEKDPEREIPAILSKNFADTGEGEYKIVDYYYSAQEPEYDMVEVSYLSEDFEGYPSGSGVAVAIDGWINKDVKAGLFWQTRAFSGNQYAHISANNSKAENDVWLITRQIDLTDASEPEFTFDVTAGYYNADCLSILVSENFDGTEAGIASATWTDISSRFNLPEGPASGYGTLGTAGTMDFSAYAGKKVYIAFHYVGNGTDNSATTTFQIDNIKLSEVKIAMSVESPARRYEAYQFTNNKWTKAASSIVVVQPEDYAEMGQNYLNSSIAPNYLPKFLAKKFTYAQAGMSKTVVYKSSNSANYADEYTLTEKEQWEVNSFVEKKKDQFVFSGYDQKGWVFDPTLTVTMVKGKGESDDYMMVVNYVIKNYESTNPSLINSYRDSEYYYGFSANYGNISLRETDRLKDTTYAALTTDEEKKSYFRERTLEGLGVYLSLKYPGQVAQVSGLDVFAVVTCAIYNGSTTYYENTFKFQCLGNDQWEFVEQKTEIEFW